MMKYWPLWSEGESRESQVMMNKLEFKAGNVKILAG